VLTDLGTLQGPSGVSQAAAINASGQVVGFSAGPSGPGAAFLYTPGVGMIDIGPGTASDINAAGDVIGNAPAASGGTFPFLWTRATGMIDLTTVVRANPGLTLQAVTAINDHGSIVGEGNIDGHGVAILLTPIPEPATVTLAVLGGLALVGYGRWRRKEPVSKGQYLG
jgi:probable HAF family extracellular repeat protein